ncbi:macrolide family glycosyltransferase [Streptomyces sp. TRM 70351]|uniref:macrolide family glycosyltransferase n=1 Tax=Streptomyces sp. TRM 70351 TaxID=3116552 RepID=UPI002E7AC069|nr:macrolide family glycosyltransferase [Streptomyces sp. TRM 70351]MEE1926819.1 macrolide family glycosyltransferase [Streptomyces sp. TRM 70351]
MPSTGPASARPAAPAHIAMMSIAAHGHVNPSLEVIRELVARGHRVTYAVPPAFTGLVASAGAQPRPYTTTLPTDQDPQAWGTELIDHIEPFLDDAVQALPQIADAYAGDEPDLVLYDIASYPGPVLAHRWKVPAVQLSPAMVAWEGYEEEVAEPLFAALRTSERGIAYYARFRAWLEANGLPGTDPDRFTGRPRRCLALIPRVLQPHADRVDPAVYTFTGPCQGDRAHQGDWRRPEGAGRVALVSLGSAFTHQPAFYRACVRAFAELPGWHLVLQIGAFTDEAALGELPPNVEVHRWVPQLRVLRQADLFVTHAGMGGSQEGLACGVPMIAVPQAADQFGNADTLTALGVARRLDTEDATPEALREAAQALLGDPGLPARFAAVQEQLRAEGGTRQAADLIEAELPAPRG